MRYVTFAYLIKLVFSLFEIVSDTCRGTTSMRVLALHGFGGADISMDLQCGLSKLGFPLEKVVAPLAPNVVRSDDGTDHPAWLSGDQSFLGKVVGFAQTDLWQMTNGFEKLPPALNEASLQTNVNIWEGVEGYEDSLDFLLRLWEENGGFDGIVAFSQGTLMAMLFASYLGTKRTELVPPKFLILIGGFMRPWPAAAISYYNPSTPSGREALRSRFRPIAVMNVIGLQDRCVAAVCSREIGILFSSSTQRSEPIEEEGASAYLGDTIVDAAQSPAMSSDSSQGFVYEEWMHDLLGRDDEAQSLGRQQGHFVPRTEDFYNSVKVFLEGLSRR